VVRKVPLFHHITEAQLFIAIKTPEKVTSANLMIQLALRIGYPCGAYQTRAFPETHPFATSENLFEHGGLLVFVLGLHNGSAFFCCTIQGKIVARWDNAWLANNGLPSFWSEKRQ